MTQNKQTNAKGGPGPLSRWIQRRANVRTSARIRRKGGSMMGMEVLILHTLGCSSRQPRETPLAWLADGEEAWLVVASGGGDRHPDWYFNLMSHPCKAAVEFHGKGHMPVTPHEPEGAAREHAWQQIATAQPRLANDQSKSDRVYPVIRLEAR